jgi:hypothetical protein
MIVPQRVWSKVRREQVLNLGELAIASGYDRNVLAKMELPLEHGKISFQDFKRIMHKRQDSAERGRAKLRVLPSPAVRSPAVNAARRQATADKFYAPSSKRAGKGASHLPGSSPLRNTA